MPELPEVEVTRRGVEPYLKDKIITSVSVHEARFRWPITQSLNVLLGGHQVQQLSRRGKYLIWHFEHGYLLIHLGMSGSLRVESLRSPLKKHDHVEWFVEDYVLRLHDPRRFGAVLWLDKTPRCLETHPLLRHLGIEPFDEGFDGEHLYQASRGKKLPVKQFLLAGHVVVGAGNIYASESLFKARINPKTPVHRISLMRYQRLALAVRETLQASIDAGGSTLRDYVGATGQTGYFQITTSVYGREGLACHICGTLIKKIIQQQRATFYCPHCQR